MLVVGFVSGILKLQAFMAYMPDIAVAAVAVVGREGKVDTVLLTLFYLRFTGVHCPLFITDYKICKSLALLYLDRHLIRQRS